MTIWPMFGIANQMLAVIALAIVSAYLVNEGRAKYLWVTVVPMLVVATTTFSAGAELLDPAVQRPDDATSESPGRAKRGDDPSEHHPGRVDRRDDDLRGDHPDHSRRADVAGDGGCVLNVGSYRS